MAVEERITFEGEGRKVEGYLALPDDRGTQLPTVLVIHEIWGLVDQEV
jgi:dienelactone hydrolase